MSAAVSVRRLLGCRSLVVSLAVAAGVAALASHPAYAQDQSLSPSLSDPVSPYLYDQGSNSPGLLTTVPGGDLLTFPTAHAGIADPLNSSLEDSLLNPFLWTSVYASGYVFATPTNLAPNDPGLLLTENAGGGARSALLASASTRFEVARGAARGSAGTDSARSSASGAMASPLGGPAFSSSFRPSMSGLGAGAASGGSAAGTGLLLGNPAGSGPNGEDASGASPGASSAVGAGANVDPATAAVTGNASTTATSTVVTTAGGEFTTSPFGSLSNDPNLFPAAYPPTMVSGQVIGGAASQPVLPPPQVGTPTGGSAAAGVLGPEYLKVKALAYTTAPPVLALDKPFLGSGHREPPGGAAAAGGRGGGKPVPTFQQAVRAYRREMIRKGEDQQLTLSELRHYYEESIRSGRRGPALPGLQ